MLRHVFEVVKNRSSRSPISRNGRRAARSLCPMAEVMEGRQLMTLIYSNSASVVEHGTGPVTMDFKVNLTSASTQAVTVNYQTADGTAIGGTDYVATSGTLTIAPGATSAMIPVTVLADHAATQNRSFSISLGGAEGATIATPKLAGTIVEQNTPPPASLTITNQLVNLGTAGVGGTMTFTVSLNEAVTTPVTVTASTKDLTAVAGVNYTARTQVLTFAPGQTTATFTVSLLGGTSVSTKYFLVDLSAASVAMGTSVAAGTIVW